MANFDENHPDVLKISPDYYYGPTFAPWTMEMERVILGFLMGQRESVERGAKKTYLSLSLPQIKALLWSRFRVNIDLPQIYMRIELMEIRYESWKVLLGSDGVFKDYRRGLVCIDTTIEKTLTYEVTELYGEALGSRRYYLYDMPPLFRMMEASFG
ncbi:hypothetical protein CASFOL_036853 [Castilleja foliolosa]|uniref:Uncharacterized protein n=1 Tax=Castilleja foliolosa TaxID=1961234 RepID=A0ABD3BP85_9LAMI